MEWASRPESVVRTFSIKGLLIDSHLRLHDHITDPLPNALISPNQRVFPFLLPHSQLSLLHTVPKELQRRAQAATVSMHSEALPTPTDAKSAEVLLRLVLSARPTEQVEERGLLFSAFDLTLNDR